MVASNHIRGLGSTVVPHWKFAATRWFRGPGQWHYHRPGLPGKASRSPRFYEQIDRDLRPLCRLIHRAGLETTPSCQGHFYPRMHFQRLWQDLRRDQELIRREGLRVRDVATDRVWIFQDPDYLLPWAEDGSFWRDASRQQGVGYLGILLPGPWPVKTDSLLRATRAVPGVRATVDPDGAQQGQGLLNLVVDTGGPAKQTLAWSRLTEQFRQALARESAAVA
ncbi:MAG: hypothetical protein ACOCTI_04335 [Phycisphaeraceae bacterium]